MKNNLYMYMSKGQKGFLLPWSSNMQQQKHLDFSMHCYLNGI